MAYEDYNQWKLRNVEAHLNNPSLSPQQQKDLKDFLRAYTEARKLRIPSQESYIRSLSFYGQYLHNLGKEFRQASQGDIENYLDSLKDRSQSVIDWAKIALKVFYKHLLLKTTDKKTKFPKIVSWLSISYKSQKKVKEEDVLTPEEFQTMLNACKHIMHRAFLHVLLDSGARLNEVLSARVRDLDLDADPPFIRICQSKTEPRVVFLIRSVHDLRLWMQAHPKKHQADFKDQYLFARVNNTRKVHSNWTNSSAYQLVQDIVKRAGLKKKIWIHLFRHTAATWDRRLGMSDQHLAIKYAWSENSKMPNRYSHINSKDVYEFQRRAMGLAPTKVENNNTICWRCKEPNSKTEERCIRCSTLLNVNKMIEESEKQRLRNEFLDKLLFDVKYSELRKQLGV